MKKYLYKHLLLALISSVCFLLVFYFALRMTQEDTPPLSDLFYLSIYMYIAAGYLTVGLLSACMTDVLGNRWTLNKTSSILLKLIVYLLITYAISRSFFVLSAPLIYLLFESFFIPRKPS
ncbi:hypothetical protein NNG64_02930 [Bacillus siamensis]|uniref:Uncharacterized protein n=1 Tax=Bacillus siamensis TaxID=659243 RepID=A0AAI8HRD2_9BACI|nr:MULTISPECIES: hypothetical protein [Bacillus]AME06273.1 hypothetical protein AUL54_07905 [Bacillus sp. SDLI1]AUJ78771.1 hypothetical protein CWD84_19150 [Bacillus siamensis]UUA84793.1 hypothetical protein NNG64_02930 [Bacillus siamensis]